MEELDTITWTSGKSKMSLRTLIEGGLSTGFVLMLVLWLSAGIETRLMKGATGEQLSLRKVVANATRGVLLFIGLLVGLSAVGLDLTALSVLGGAVGVGIGLGLQKLAANYVSGFVILTERALRIGDLIKVDNFEGRITDITTRYTLVRSTNGREAIVPNEMLTTQRVENASLADPDMMLTSSVRVAYGSDVEALVPQLLEAISAVPRVIEQPAASVQLNAFAVEGIELVLNYWIRDPENGIGNVRSEVNFAALRCIVAAGIEIKAGGV
jgi:small-conductance mechanosensitive channel